MSAEELRRIEAARAALQEAMGDDDHRLIRERLEELNQATHNLAELLMNTAVRAAVKGKRPDEVSL